ncbi:hypothetical protein K469DRAFT_186339 [Zopfia rhizophila CBS 207.26]|uniref:Uncharacterized protein n=1 Tax=Zopfia rhizophila CBS 207.26 TaxID=1314779 RepID=A0A6A6DXV5_9PEZI|nr:hypothetical protein K469DRAFT_186339 [Zopfia rhizophila CBS 207.26]
MKVVLSKSVHQDCLKHLVLDPSFRSISINLVMTLLSSPPTMTLILLMMYYSIWTILRESARMNSLTCSSG